MNGVPLTYWYTDTEPFSFARSSRLLRSYTANTEQCSNTNTFSHLLHCSSIRCVRNAVFVLILHHVRRCRCRCHCRHRHHHLLLVLRDFERSFCLLVLFYLCSSFGFVLKAHRNHVDTLYHCEVLATHPTCSKLIFTELPSSAPNRTLIISNRSTLMIFWLHCCSTCEAIAIVITNNVRTSLMTWYRLRLGLGLAINNNYSNQLHFSYTMQK